ncbi:MAG: type VI secretion system tip protein TssI/VgrG [Polyangiaceae bacterium]
MNDSFVVASGALPEGARVMGFKAVEAISRPYQIDLFVSVGEGRGVEVDLDDALGARITLAANQTVKLRAEDAAKTTMDALRAMAPPFQFQGIASAVELVNDFGGRSVFRFTIVPQLYRLGQSLHSRVFTKQSVIDIVRAILDEAGLSDGEDYEFRLASDYPVEEHVCQYKESDLAFISRWMEREGLYYYFEHEGTNEKLVITDDKSFQDRIAKPVVRYHPASGDETAGGGLHTASLRHRALPASVHVRDYDYSKPALDVSGLSPVSDTGLGEISLYGDRFFTPDQGTRLARLRAETFRATQNVLRAGGTVHHLRSGYRFELEHHPRPELDREYLITEVHHVARCQAGVTDIDALLPPRGKDDALDVYRVEVSAIPADVQFRAERSTPWPRIHCFEQANVDGPAASQYAQIDSQGRYAIKFKFDESILGHGKASTWVRMAQPHGGSVEGFHFPLRKGTEVLVTFMGGDPDRPVIAAVLPNAATPSPVDQGSHTKNVLQTGGSTRIEIEDLAGGQYMKQFTPVQNTMLWMGTDATSPKGHNVELSTDGSGFQSFGTYLDQFVGAHKNEQVIGPVERTYENTYSTKVTGDVTQTYLANQTTTVDGDVVRTIHGTLTETVDGAVSQTYHSTWTVTVDADVAHTYKANHKLDVTADQAIKVTGATTHQFDAGLNVTVNGKVSSHTANVGYQLEAKPDATMHATAKFDIRGDATAKLSAPATTIQGDTSVDVNGGTTITIGPTNILVNGSEIITLSGPTTIEILGGDIKISGGNIVMAATATINQTAAGKLSMSGAGAQLDGGPVCDIHGGVIKLNA